MVNKNGILNAKEAQILAQYPINRIITADNRYIRRTMRGTPLQRHDILGWKAYFGQRRSLAHRVRNGCPRHSEDIIRQVPELFE